MNNKPEPPRTIGLMEKELWARYEQAIADALKSGGASHEGLKVAAETYFAMTIREKWDSLRFEMSRDDPLIAKTDIRVVEAYREYLRDLLDDDPGPLTDLLLDIARDIDETGSSDLP